MDNRCEILKDLEQGSDAWLQARCGVITASNFSAVISKGATRKTYLMKMAAERITGEVGENFTNKAMEWGTAHEPQARANYELETFNDVEEVGFIVANDWVGVSPDGLIGDNGLLEIKCPNTNTHIETVLSNKMPAKHKPQVQGQLLVSKREWCDFVSYDPRVPNHKLFITRVSRDEKYIKELELAIDQFTNELQEIFYKFSNKEAA